MRITRFFREVYRDNDLRLQNRRSLGKDLFLYVRNRALQPIDWGLVQRWRNDDHTIGFILSAPRSGTTLLFQLIARYLDVGYPSNAVARYWMCPLVGSVVASHRFGERPAGGSMTSEFGGTEGPLEPHEFSWFWQYIMEFRHTDELTEAELDDIDWRLLRRKVSALAGRLDRSYVFKSLNYTVFNVERFARELPQSKFIYIRRDPRFVVQSILESRVKRYGDEMTWWTLRPRDYRDWMHRPPLEQVCHQVSSIRGAIETDLARLPEERHVTLDYEDLVADPVAALHEVSRILGTGCVNLEELRALDLENMNIRRMDDARFRKIPELMEMDA